jgi:recombination protein RecA
VSVSPLEAFGKRWNTRAKRTVAYAGDDAALDLTPVPLGLETVDEVLGGGFPRGRTTMLIGEPSSGKTLITQLLIANVQRGGGLAIYVDAERTYSARWFATTGVVTDDTNSFIVLRPDTLEQCFDMVVDALDSVRPDVLAIDSVAALVPEAIIKAKMEDKDFRGVFPRKLTEGVAKATQYNRATALVLVNQLRTNMNVKFGNPESYPGGRALRHYSTVILRTRQGKWLTDKGTGVAASEVDDGADAKRIGFQLRLRADKNKQAAPWQETEVRFMFSGEVDALGGLVTMAIERGVIEARSGYYSAELLPKQVHGREALEDLLRRDAALHAELLRAVREV